MREWIYAVLKLFFPFLLRWGKNIKKKFRRKKLHKKQQSGSIITKQKLVNDLRNLGVRPTSSLMVHSSLRKIGYVEGAEETVVSALLEVLTDKGTLLCPTSTADKLYKHYLEENPVFDVRNSSSKYGAITEWVRKMPGAFRSIHPTESVAAVGPLAHFYTKDHYGQLTPYNENSPYYKLCEIGGDILLLGVPLGVCINLHVMEDLTPDFKFPIYHPKIFSARVIDYEGKETVVQTKAHDPKYAYIRKPNELLRSFEKEGIIKKGKIGEADAILINARALLQTMTKLYQEKGITMYSPNGL